MMNLRGRDYVTFSVTMPYFCRRFDAIFYTDNNQPFEEHILKKYLKPNGSYVSTVPEQLKSDSLGFICETIFAGCVRVKLLVQVRLNLFIYRQFKVIQQVESLTSRHIFNYSTFLDSTCINGRKARN